MRVKRLFLYRATTNLNYALTFCIDLNYLQIWAPKLTIHWMLVNHNTWNKSYSQRCHLIMSISKR